ncbi:hypothetical protein HDV00_012153 [Rhizophlyctis rosea]|nr:hypothetical protein HDV00_012153 [Rhizophlyctis rosea]
MCPLAWDSHDIFHATTVPPQGVGRRRVLVKRTEGPNTEAIAQPKWLATYIDNDNDDKWCYGDCVAYRREEGEYDKYAEIKEEWVTDPQFDVVKESVQWVRAKNIPRVDKLMDPGSGEECFVIDLEETDEDVEYMQLRCCVNHPAVQAARYCDAGLLPYLIEWGLI